MKLFKRAALPATVFAAVFALHFLWHGIFPEIPAEQSRWAVVNTEASWMRTYLESQSYWLGFSYALSLAFASGALRRYREERLCGARNVAIGGITFSGFLAVAGCYSLGCCGSPMLAVYASLLGTAFLPFARPIIAVLTMVSVIAAYRWMENQSRRRKASGVSCGETCSPAITASPPS